MFIVFTIFGGYSNGDHLFPFRTEKLSPFAQMVLPYKVGEYVAASFKETPIERSGFCFLVSTPLDLTNTAPLSMTKQTLMNMHACKS